jgi:hypothetical protein
LHAPAQRLIEQLGRKFFRTARPSPVFKPIAAGGNEIKLNALDDPDLEPIGKGIGSA